MRHPKLAAIDIGTNTFRLLIAEVNTAPGQTNYSIKEICSKRTITRLGNGIADSGVINEQAVTRGIKALKQFSRIISRHKVEKISAVATSALREAKNSRHFLDKARAEAGLDIKVISGRQEAKLTASGMLIDMTPPKSALMLDIGGGSTELIFMKGGKPPAVHSLDLGVVYLAGKYMISDPPLTGDLIQMEEETSGKIKSSVKSFKKLFSRDTVCIGTAGTVTALAAISQDIGTAGTVTALAAISQDIRRFNHNKIHKSILTLENVRNIFSTLSGLSSKERAEYVPFELARLDIIVPGTLILLKLMDSFGFKEMTVSNYGLLEGTLLDLCKKERK
ncbi:MAG: Ppx/GppA family phosphatase [Nitrospirae bacterium]|nr:Ppx/GppA family phosphatase [Nitrospirota bacterium]